MKVLFVTGEFPPMQGGVGDYTREIGLALGDLGCEVAVASSTQAGPTPGLTVHPTIKGWGWGVWGALLDLARRERPDVVHIQYQAAAYGLHPAINLFPRRLRWLGSERPRTAVTFHDLRTPYLFPKAGPLRRWIVHELARGCDLAITTNRDDHEALRQAVRPGQPLQALVPIGSNIAPPRALSGYDRGAWRARWGAGPGDLLLCFFGFVNDRKGVDTLLQALKLLVDKPGEAGNPHLMMIGGQTGASDPTNVAYLAHIRTLINELGLGERVRWTGYTPAEEVSANFWAADLCVLPFRDGVSFLHGTFHAALAHGMAIVTTRPRTALPELVDGENIALAPPRDPAALAAAVRRLAADAALRQRIGAGARALAEQFGWGQIAADTLELYRKIKRPGGFS
ncbi:MAG: glycosyltransferase family 4 protein [Anaerolineae bacterium]|nr:glycosyltransferase family 4 protein [Anaerolineae bacterium]